MRRIVETSRGWIDIDLSPHGWHGATVYEEDGWEAGGAVWHEKHGRDAGEPTLAAFIASTAGLPPEEAERIADTVLREWDGRGQTDEVERERRQEQIGARAVAGVAGLALLGLAAAVAGAVWFVAHARAPGGGAGGR